MLLGDSTLGNTTIGFSSTQVDLTLTSATTSSYTGTITAGHNLLFESTSTSSAVINNRVDLAYTASTTGGLTLNSSKGVLLSIGATGPDIGGFSVGDSNLGYETEPSLSTSEIVFGSTKGISQTWTASSDSNLTINRRIDLTLSALAQSSSDWVVTKGVELRFDSETNSTLVLIPDFDEIIGKSRADGTQQQIVRSNGERIFILEAEGQID